MSELYMDSRPRVVSIYELLSKLLPLMQGYAWAEDALMDLWLLGAPDPSPHSRPCPEGKCALEAAKKHKCVPKWGCAMVKRTLLPQQFVKWWQDVANRQGLELTALQALDGAHERFAKATIVKPIHRNGYHGRARRNPT